MNLRDEFASLFASADAKTRLAKLANAKQPTIPTYTITISSLRNTPRWFDRIEAISNGELGSHSHFLSDPVRAGLVDVSGNAPVLTSAGQQFLSNKAAHYMEEATAEYDLLKALYFSNHSHTTRTTAFLQQKRDHMNVALQQFMPAPSRKLFFKHPSLLVIAELIASFSGAVTKLLQLPDQSLIALASLSEEEFRNLNGKRKLPTGLTRLCERIANEYRRSEERRLHHLMSMTLLSIAASIPRSSSVPLTVPFPFSNFVTEQDIFEMYARYTSDVTIWHDGETYQVSSSFASAANSIAVSPPVVPPVRFLPLPDKAPGTGTPVAANAVSRSKRRASQHTTAMIVYDQTVSERSEDYAEVEILKPRYGNALFRVGHRSGETMALEDGMVPGADFYVVDAKGIPIEFIEVKSFSGNLPTQISLTHAEFLRAKDCSARNIRYRIVLVDVANARTYELSDFAQTASLLTVEELLQFTVRIGPT